MKWHLKCKLNVVEALRLQLVRKTCIEPEQLQQQRQVSFYDMVEK